MATKHASDAEIGVRLHGFHHDEEFGCPLEYAPTQLSDSNAVKLFSG